MKRLILALTLLAAPAQAQDIAHPTCGQMAFIQLSAPGEASYDLMRAYLIQDWQGADTIPAPGQGPITPIMVAHYDYYATMAAEACDGHSDSPLAYGATVAYLQARKDIYGQLPQ